MSFLIESPVAFFVFNRPDVTEETFKAISKLRPSKLFLIADGPREGKVGESERTEAVRRIVGNVDWPCEVKVNFSDVNLGCKERIISGIDWVFLHVDRAIILEDDCVPTVSFGMFCDAMLSKYEEDKKIFSVSGSNFSVEEMSPGYYSSDYSLMWGWATWRDRWALYRAEGDGYIPIVAKKWWKKPGHLLYWLNVLWRVRSGRLPGAWDYQWILTHWRNGARSIRPTGNMVRNIGFGPDATHTKSENRFLGQKFVLSWSKDYVNKQAGVADVRTSNEADDKYWAMINYKTILLLYFPFLRKFKRNRVL